MNHDDLQLDPIETALKELAEAEKAGLFNRTAIDARGLLKGRSDRRGAELVRAFLRPMAVAAGLGIVILSAFLLIRSPGETNVPAVAGLAGAAGTESETGCATIVNCLTGPRRVVLAASCTSYDYDGDSDVDQYDVRSHVLRCGAGEQASQ